ncbi:MAG: D-hexose-6-phosphate mutarotase [Burkholderiales bacterium]
MTDLSTLNTRYTIPGQLSFGEAPGGLVVAEISNAQAAATIALQGAHVMNWAPRGAQPVIWLSRAAKFVPGKSIRGGVPICWPWFGPPATESSFPAHGFARTTLWEVVETRAMAGGATQLVFSLIPTAATRAQWPHPTTLECHITVGTVLEIELVTRNTDTVPVTIGDALHTYFAVGDVRNVAIRGLEDCLYIDKVNAGKRESQVGPVTFSAETDRIYLDTGADCLIEDPQLRRRIRVSKRGSHSTVVWNPWVEKAAKMGDLGENGYLNMVCVESTNAAEDVITIAPEAEHRLWVRYSVEALN